MIKFTHGDYMKKIFFLILILVPINIYSLDYIVNKNNYKIHITDNNNINNSNEIIIIDDRKNNKNIKIKNSYRINNSNQKKEIIDEILKYTKEHPAKNWIRSKNTMYMEWNFHNILYKLNLFKSHTISVDFESNDEIKYYFIIFYLQKIINML